MEKFWSRRDAIRALSLSLGTAAIPFSSWAVDENSHPILLPGIKLNLDRPVTAITCGAGSRGNVYGNYAVQYPGQLDIIGVAEPIALRNERYAKKHSIQEENRFTTWEDVFKRPKFADAIIITTPDNLHYGPCMKALEMGYDVLLEKPISPSEKECRHNSKETTPIILAKSCHDLDILRWMLGKSCTHIQAFGSLQWFTKKNAPEGSTARCADGCKVESKCPYSALEIYYRKRQRNYVFDLPEEKDKQAEFVLEQLKTTNYGRCVYRMENDQPDHYTTNILFEGGVTAAFSMEAFTSYEGRRTRVMGGLGDVVGDMTSFTMTDFLTDKKTEWKQESDGHGGGDWRLVADWINAVSQQNPALLTSTIDASIESHVMGFMAEQSRKKNKVMEVKL